MGALNGSISCSKFYVEGELPKDYKERFVRAIQHRVFVPLTAEDEEDERMGWCSVEHPLDLDLDAYKVFYNGYLNLGLRIDKWSIPSPILKAYLTEAERRYLAQENKERLSRNEKMDLKTVVVAELKHKLMPSMKVIDMSWNIHSGVLRFWNQSAKTCEVFQEFFEETFEMNLIPENPYTAALQLKVSDEQARALMEIHPSVLHTEMDLS